MPETAPPPSRRRALSTDEILRLAQALHRDKSANRLDEAANAYAHVLQKQPDHPEALTGLGLLRARLGQLDAAEALLRRALAVRPGSAQAANTLGALLLSAGKPAAALGCFETGVALRPDLAEAHNNKGRALAALGRHGEAIASYEAALGIRPDLVLAEHNLGAAWLALNEPARAIPHLERAASLQPGLARAHESLGRAQAALRKHEAAVASFERALAAGRATAELHNDLGASLAALKRHEAALPHFRQACALRPDMAAAHSNLGNALMACERHAEAMACYRTALALDPELAEAHGNLGSALLDMQRPDDALPHLDRAVALDPALAAVHNLRGQVLIMAGRLEEARLSFARATALAPDTPAFYAGLAATHRLDAGDPRTMAMEAMLREPDVADHGGEVALRFALHRVYESQGRFEEAFAHLLRGNALRRAATDYDEKASLRHMDRIRSMFGPERLRDAPPRSGVPDRPIFILGMPRSGSTLIEQILSSHAEVSAAGEVRLLSEEAAALGNAQVPKLAFPGNIAACAAPDFAAAGDRYRRRLQALAPGASRITDKMPGNFQLVGLIRLMLPDARVIHTRRDPGDTCVSCFALTFGKQQPFTYDLAELGRFYAAYAGLMAHWRAVLPEPFMLEVQYEDVVADTEAQVRRILDFCGLGWDPACLEFHRNPRTVLTASARQVREPIYSGSVGRARHYGAWLGPLRDALGDLAER